MKALDLSFSSASFAWCQGQKAAGWQLLIADLWTGVSTPAPARANLANARQAGMLTAGYTVVNSLPGITAINKAAAAAGPEWEHLSFVSVDVEVQTTPAIVREAVDGLRALGKKVCIYTGGWFWNQFGGNFDFSDVPAWLADYDGSSVLDTPRLGRLGPVIGKQYRGSHDIGGVTVDANTFDDAFVSPQEEEMTKMRFIQAPAGPEWVTDGVFKMGITDGAIKIDLVNLGLADPGTSPVAQEFADWLIDYPKDIAAIMAAPSVGPGLSFDDVVGAAKRAAKEGAG